MRRPSTLVLLVCSIGFLTGCGGAINNVALEQPGSTRTIDLAATNPEPVPPQERATDPASVAPPQMSSSPGPGAYKIGPQDVLSVSVFKVPELSTTVQVADAGTVNLPLVGEIPAAGRTAKEVEEDLTQRLGAKYIKKPQVTVLIREYNSQIVTVEGAVKSPGVKPLRGRTTLIQVVAMSGGLDQSYDSTVVVFRESNGQRLAARFDVDDIRNGKAEDPPLQGGDTIIVGQSFIKKSWDTLLKSLPVAGFFMGVL